MNRLVRLLILVAALALGAAPLVAQPLDPVEQFRDDLLLYVSELQALPAPLLAEFQASHGNLIDARTSIQAMSRDEIAAIQVQMDRLPFWRGVPGMLAKALATSAGPSPLDVAGAVESRVAANAELSRVMLRTMFIHFRSIPAERVHPDYRAEVDRIEAMIDQASPDELVQIQREIAPKLEVWNQKLGAVRAGSVMTGEGFVTANNHCGTSFPTAIVCEIGHIFDDIVAFFNSLPGLAEAAFNDITNFFGDLVADIPGSFTAVVSELGLDDVDWEGVAQTALDYARLPCPPEDFLLPGFGRVGELETFTNFSGTIGFAGNAITELTPSDILTSVNLQAVMIVINFPIQWLSRCLENSWDDNWEAMQAGHRSLVATNLNVTASSRVSQLSLNAGQSKTNDIRGDVATIEAKLDGLGAQLDGIETSTVDLIAKSTSLEEKIDNLQVQQGQTGDTLDALRVHLLRMLIEKNLFGHGNFTIGLFQVPGSLGGLLETAASIVGETIQNRLAAGVNMKNATREYNNGVAQHAAGNFKAAYEHFRNAYSHAVN